MYVYVCIYILYVVFASTISILMVLMDVYGICGIVIDKYGGWLRNPAPPKGWLKFYKSWDKPYVWYMYLVGALEPWNFMTFHSVGKNHPNLFSIFQRG